MQRRFERLADFVVLAAPPATQETPHPVDRLTRRLAARLLRGIDTGRPVRLVYLSTTGVYGDRAGRWTDETTPIRPTTARAVRRANAERWLRRTARASPRLQASVLRVPGIYAAERLPLARLAERLPALRPEDDVVTNHIHADDLARILRLALLRASPQRVYNAVDDSALPMGDYLDAVAAWAGLPTPPRLARAELLQQVSAVRASFMSESRRLSNRRMKRELRPRLRYPTVAHFLATTLPPAKAARAPADIMRTTPV